MTTCRRAFTLVEVLACTMVLGMGLLAACALVMYGYHLVDRARKQTIGMATAMSVLVDPTPLATDPTLSPNGATTTGYLNRLWVERREVDPMPLDGAAAKLISVTVNVDVYDTANGELVVSMSRRLIRQQP